MAAVWPLAYHDLSTEPYPPLRRNLTFPWAPWDSRALQHTCADFPGRSGSILPTVDLVEVLKDHLGIDKDPRAAEMESELDTKEWRKPVGTS